MPKPNLMSVSCPDCGQEAALDFAQLKRNANLTMTCGKCSLIHLAFNAMSMSMYEHLKAKGVTSREPPKPQRLEPVAVFPGKDGTEVVFRRFKNGTETAYTRRAKRRKNAPK